MKLYSFLKFTRVIIALIAILAISFVFCDIYRVIPPHLARTVSLTQFFPSVLSAINFRSLAYISSIAIIILTLTSGRIYCSCICPFGILQDVISRIAATVKRRRYSFSQPHNLIRYSILTATVISYISVGTSLILWLDPFSLHGRIITGTALPAAVKLNNISANLSMKAGIYSLYPVDLKLMPAAVILITSTIIVMLIVAVLLKGRIYCNTICPVGSFLALISKISLFKISIDRNSCIHCGRCESSCKSSCISHSNEFVDFTRCVACFNCTVSCPNGSIGYNYNPLIKRERSAPFMDKNNSNTNHPAISRRTLLAGILLIPGLASSQQNKKKPDLIYQTGLKLKEFKKNIFTSPPGSASIERFNTKCTACSLCINACPSSVLQPAVLQYGISGIMQPFQDFNTGYCNYDCTICSEICPSGAIIRIALNDKHRTVCGESHFIMENCVTYTNGTACGACSEHCPTKAIGMVPFRKNLLIPEVNGKLCIGCGACEYVCPVRPYKAIYVEGLKIHGKADLPEKTKKVIIRDEEFPF